VAAVAGQAATSARLLGTAEALAEGVGALLEPSQSRQEATARVRAELGDERFSEAMAAGRAMTLPEAPAEAETGAQIIPPPPRDRPASAGPLSPRELEVLRLLIAGRSAPEIASELFISPRTVTTHISNILDKLGVDTRAAAVAVALRNGWV